MTGTDSPVDPAIQKELNADSSLNRDYRRSDGSSVIVHVSSFTNREEVSEVIPHDPHVCYLGAGWRTIEEHQIDIDTAIGKLPYRIMIMERSGSRSALGFWYQMGSTIFSTYAEGKKVHRQFWGKKQWPATIKFMIQVQAQDIETARSKLDPVASSLYEWAAKL